ncbi:MAG: DUF188 domain-containing protein [Treponema sp.]|nr:DUF188 domain-containing protein [Treponema sp.]
MQILVDADSCPRQVRELILRSSKRTKIPVIFAANRPIPGIEDKSMEICPLGDGSADNRIVELANAGDLAVTRDIPLAERLVDKGICVLDDRGRVYTEENIRYCRSLRDFSVGLAENGMGIVRTANYGKKELKAFADSFDRELTRLKKNQRD